MSDVLPNVISTPRRKPPVRKPSKYRLVWITEIDAGDTCYVELPIPPGLEEAQLNNRAAIKAAVRSAVYDKGMKEYGNKKLAVISYTDEFEFAFVEETQVVLRPPKPGEMVNPQGTVVDKI